MNRRRYHRRGFTLRDLLVAMCVLLFVASIGLAQLTDLVETALQLQCSANLEQIGQAVRRYADGNHGAYPRTIYDVRTADRPVWGTGNDSSQPGVTPFKDGPEKPNDVSAAFFLLLRSGEITSGAFVCPSSNCTPWDFGGGGNRASNWVNWPAQLLPKHLSYSFANPYPNESALRAGYRLTNDLAPDFAVAADINPGTPVVFNPSVELMRAGNSRNHNKDGQNVLYGDGHVMFVNNPYCGNQRDNIYTYGGVVNNTPRDGAGTGVVGSPVDLTDSVLLPVAQGQGYGALDTTKPAEAPSSQPAAAAVGPH